jgi:hypothetical protein
MRKLLSVLTVLALIFTGFTQVQAFEPQAFDQATALRDAERFLRGLGYSPTTNDINLQANAFYFAYRQGALGNLNYNVDNETALDLILVSPTQDQLDLEKSILERLWTEGLRVYFRVIIQEENVQEAINSVAVQDLISSAALTAYAQGFGDGQTQTTGTSVNALASFVPQVLGVGFGFMLQIASFEVLGVSLLSVIALMVTISGTLLALKVTTGGR